MTKRKPLARPPRGTWETTTEEEARNGSEYLPAAWLRAHHAELMGEGASPARTEAGAYMLELIGRDLRAAREHAGFTQAELAEKIGKAEGVVSNAEAGKIRVSEKYVKSVLKACRLPEDWVPGVQPP